nr:MAG TPA: repressor domain protein [Bacteriophage sp.]
MSNQISTQTVSFNNQSLITIEQNGVHYVAMKPICENIGIQWESQYNRIRRDDVLNSVIFIMNMTGSDSKNYQMICLPIEYLNGWLFGIDINRCKPEIRDTLIKYQKECYQALHDYWFNGKAERKTTADDRTGLRNAVNMLVSKKGLIYSDAYNLVHQYMNVETIEDIPADKLQSAVEYVHRIVLEGELITEPKKDYRFSFEFTEHELQQLVWAWFALLRGTELCQNLLPALKQIGSHYAAPVHDMAYEYRSTLRQAQKVLERITKKFEYKQGNNWRVLKYLRAYNPKATGFQLDIL